MADTAPLQDISRTIYSSSLYFIAQTLMMTTLFWIMMEMVRTISFGRMFPCRSAKKPCDKIAGGSYSYRVVRNGSSNELKIDNVGVPLPWYQSQRRMPVPYKHKTVVADFDGDGREQVVMRSEASGATPSTRLFSFNGTTLAGKTVQIEGPGTSLWESPTAPDIDGDGRAEMIYGTKLYRMGANGNFSVLKTVPEAAAVGDVNGDGKSDRIAFNSLNYGVTVSYSKGDGFADPVLIGTLPFPADQKKVVTVADFDGDGRADIAVQPNPAATVSRIFFARADQTWPYRDVLSVIGAADFNGDGRADLMRATAPRSARSGRVTASAARCLWPVSACRTFSPP